MPYDTIKLKSPSLDRSLMKRIEAQCVLRSGLHLGTGEVLYELFTGELLGSWDARISVLPKYEDYELNDHGRPVLRPCEPYLLIEASAHKVLLGHNVYGGPSDFQQACRALVHLVEELLDTDLPGTDNWTVHRVDVAEVFRMRKAAAREFFDGIQLLSFPRRKRGASKYEMAVHFAGKTTCVKIYHKGSEFGVHDRARLRSYFGALFGHLYGKGDAGNAGRVERKLQALQRLADARLRCEVEVLSDKFQYGFGCNPRVCDVTDAYARVSTNDQDTALQRDALRRAGVRRVFDEKRRAVAARPQLDAALRGLRPGDVVVVYKVDGLARSLSDLLSILRRIEDAGAEFRSLTEPIDTTTAAGRLMLQLLGAFAEFERSLIRERSAAGLVAARERGVKLGRPRSMSVRDEASAVRSVRSGLTLSEVARRHGVHPSTVAQALKRASEVA